MKSRVARLWFSSLRQEGRCLRRARLRVEELEHRLAPAVITVTTVADDITPNDGSVSLREAITAVNAGNDLGDPDITAQNPGTFGTNDTINFNIKAAGVQTINVGTDASAAGIPLPSIVKPVTINGYTQGVATANTLANADNAVILIQLDGTGAGTAVNGLTLDAGSAGSTIEGLDITNFQADASLNGGVGILVQSNGNTIVGNFVGVNPAGTAQMPNGGDGIRIVDASNNIIGTTNSADRNISSGNILDGIHVEGAIATPAIGNLIQGNFIGVAADGVGRVGVRTVPVPNAGALGTDAGNFLFGIEISGGNNNTVGGTVAGARNVVGFNTDGIEIDNGGQGNIIQGNFSGVGADGVTPVKNLLHGIALRSSNTFNAPLGPAQPNEPGVSFNLIGGTVAGAGNLVEFNGTAGIAVFGNPVSASGQPNIGNAIEGNSVFQNGRNNPTALVGIDLTNQFKFPPDDGVTPNDSKGHGAPNDPNNFQNFPVLTAAVPDSGKTDITGTLKSAPGSTLRIEFFASDLDPLGGISEGQQFLGFVNATADAGGNATFSVPLNVPVAVARIVTATATDGIGNTSEFSPGIFVGTANQVFVIKVYRDLLGRLPEPGGLAAWSGLLNQGVAPSQLVLDIETDAGHEYYAKLVQSFYQLYLQRAEGPADGMGPAGFVDFLAAGGTVEQLRAVFTSSAEYFSTRALGTNSGFINALYLDAFNTPNRLATDPGAQSFKQQLDNGTLTRAQVSGAIFGSTEFRDDLVQSFYTQFLNRSGSNAEINIWASSLAAGATDQQVLAQILGSPESFNTPPSL